MDEDTTRKNIYLTVITATHNRLDALKGLYASLCGQSSGSFEWIVIVDGAEDGTAEWLAQIEGSTDFAMRYLVKENGGKHTALNRAFAMAEGRYAIMVDDDDRLLPGAIEQACRLGKITDQMHSNARAAGKSPICAFVTPMLDADGKTLNSNFPPDGTISDFVDMRFRLKVMGDLREVLRVKYLRQFRFPEISGEKFFPESYLFASLALHFKCVFFNTPLVSTSYSEQGLSAGFVRLMLSAPRACAMLYPLLAGHPSQTFKGRMISRMLFWTYTLGSDIPWRERLCRIGRRALPLLPPAALLRAYYYLRPSSPPLI